MNRCTLRLIALTGILASPLLATDLTGSYEWKPIAIGAGGCGDGVLISETDPNVRFARVDTGQYYRWSVADDRWLPMVVQNDDGSGFGKAIFPEPSHSMTAVNNDGGSFALDPNDNKTIYLYLSFGYFGTYGALPYNVYKSTEGGKNFSATHFNDAAGFNLKTNDTFLESFRTDGDCLTVDPNNSKVVYIGTGTRGLFKSCDAGDTWGTWQGGGLPALAGKSDINILPYKKGGTTQVNGVTVSKIVYLVWARDPAVVGMVEPAPAGAKAGVVAALKVDGKPTLNLIAKGELADTVKAEIGKKADVIGAKKDANLTVTAISETTLANVYRSADGGQTWANITQDSGPARSCHAGVLDQNNAALYVIGKIPNDAPKNGLCKYENGTWSLLEDDVSQVAVDPKNSSNLVIYGGVKGPLGVSDDGGKTWKRNKWTGHNCGGTQTQGFAGTEYPEFSGCCKLLMDTTGMVWNIEGNDGMVTWKFDASKSPATHPWIPNTKGIENFCSQEIVFLKNRGGKAVVSVQDNTGLLLNNLDTFDVKPIISIAWYMSNNGSAISVCPNDPDTFSIINCWPCITTDGGKNFTAFNDTGKSGPAKLVEPWQTHPRTLATFETLGTIPKGLRSGSLQISRRGDWKAGDDHLVWLNGKMACYSKDGGKTWAKSTTDFGAVEMDLAPWGMNRNLVADPFTPDKFYVYFAQNGFWTTVDGGVTWTLGHGIGKSHTGGTLRANELVPNDLWLSTGSQWVSAGGGLFHSTDAGVTWKDVPGNGGLPLIGCQIALGKGRGQPGDAPYTVYYIYRGEVSKPAKDEGLYRSTNAGVSWDRIARHPAGLLCPSSMGASWDTFGLVGVAINGQGFVYGKPKD